MLAKKYRLPVQSVLNQKGLTRRGRYFFVKIFKTAKNYPRIGVVVSIKVSPKATGRNKLKRVVYAEVRRIFKELAPYEYLVIVQRGAYEALGNNAIISELRSLFKS